MWIVQYSLKQLIVSVLQQLFEVWHVRWTEAASEWNSLPVWRDSSVSLYIRIQAPTENVLISSTVNTTTNEVNARRARLVLGRVTVFGRVYHLGM